MRPMHPAEPFKHGRCVDVPRYFLAHTMGDSTNHPLQANSTFGHLLKWFNGGRLSVSHRRRATVDGAKIFKCFASTTTTRGSREMRISAAGYEAMADLTTCQTCAQSSDGADRSKSRSRNACYRASSHQHRFSKAGLHPAGPSTWGLRKTQRRQTSYALLHRQSHQPSSCVAGIPTPLFTALSRKVTGKLRNARHETSSQALAPDSAQVKAKRPL